MIREIKFDYLIQSGNIFRHNYLTLATIEKGLNLALTFADKIHKRQFTGLKDKNGIEIYEGDIVKVQARFDHCVGPIFYNDDETSFCFTAKEDELPIAIQHRKLRGGWYGVEVIGNIYETPEVKS